MKHKKILALVLAVSVVTCQTAMATNVLDAALVSSEPAPSVVENSEPAAEPVIIPEPGEGESQEQTTLAEPSEPQEGAGETSGEESAETGTVPAPETEGPPENTEPSEPAEEPDSAETDTQEPSEPTETPAVNEDNTTSTDQAPTEEIPATEADPSESTEQPPVEHPSNEEPAAPSEAPAEGSQDQATNSETSPAPDAVKQNVVKNPVLDTLNIRDTVTADKNGNIPLPAEGKLADFLFPSELGGQTMKHIAAGSFRGCPYFKTVTIPASITEIGANAFADCEGLEYIILLDRAEADGMTLGENWCGNAVVVYGLVVEIAQEEADATGNASVPVATPEQAEGENQEQATPAEPSEPQEGAGEASDEEPAETGTATEPETEGAPENTEPSEPTETPSESLQDAAANDASEETPSTEPQKPATEPVETEDNNSTPEASDNGSEASSEAQQPTGEASPEA